MMQLDHVSKIACTAEERVLMVSCNVTINGEALDIVHTLRPDDPYGISPAIRQWLEENPLFPIVPYVPPLPPTDEEKRAQLAPLTARQFRLALVAGGFTPGEVTQTIENLPNGAQKEAAKIEWEYAATFNRMHPLIATVAAELGLNDSQIDAMWLAAVDL